LSKKLPPKKELPITEPKSFHLRTEDRAVSHRVPTVVTNERPFEFRAQPIPEAIFEPFVPKKSERPLTLCEDPGLNTELRAEERKQFDQLLEEKRRIEEEEMEILEAERQRTLEYQLKKLRKQLVHKAKPAIFHKPEPVKRSDRPLTVPASPLIGVKRRRLMDHFKATRNEGPRRDSELAMDKYFCSEGDPDGE
jgi:hypothetical protein